MGVIRMKKYRVGLLLVIFLGGCVHQHQINIGDISVNEQSTSILKYKEYYMSFTQEYYDNKRYPLSEYCNDQRTYLADDKFSTETYIKVTNERTKQSRVGKYPIWFLLNDDASNIFCVKKSTNFINSEPFIVSSTDELSLSILQKNEAKKSVPVRELGVLINFVSLVVPQTANFLLKADNIIKDPVTRNYLEMMDNSFRYGDLDGTKTHPFNTKTKAIKIKLYVPAKDNSRRELGYIVLKPKYRTTLSTVNIENGIPNFRFIYSSTDPQIEDLMQYKLPNRHVRIQVVVDNFKQVSGEHIVEALVSLNTDLRNRFTRFDRALILSLALRQSDLYKNFRQSVRTKDIAMMKKYLAFFNNPQNPLQHLLQELKVTKCEYYSLIQEAEQLIKKVKDLEEQQSAEEQRIKEEELRHQIKMRNIENFLSPVANWNYIDQMFSANAQIVNSFGELLDVHRLQQTYSREHNVSEYGCYVDLEQSIYGVTIQEYLIHPSYTNGEKYHYMALSVNRQNQVDVIFYKLTPQKPLKISKIFIDSNTRFISRHRIKEVISKQNTRSCSKNIRRLF